MSSNSSSNLGSKSEGPVFAIPDFRASFTRNESELRKVRMAGNRFVKNWVEEGFLNVRFRT